MQHVAEARRDGIIHRLVAGISAIFVVGAMAAWWMLLLQGVKWLISN
jgi:hypothetical protein